jgi:hypothetical protein
VVLAKLAASAKKRKTKAIASISNHVLASFETSPAYYWMALSIERQMDECQCIFSLFCK